VPAGARQPPLAAPPPGRPRDRPHVTGRVTFTSEGYGFLAPDAVGAGGPLSVQDVFVPARERRGACDKDRVEAVVLSGRDGRQFARVLRVLERHHQTLVGVFEKTALGGRVRSARARGLRDVRILPGDAAGARGGDRVSVDVVQFPTSHRADLIGRVRSVLGPAADPRTDMRAIACEFGIPMEFPERVVAAARAAAVAAAADADAGRRVDLRSESIVTIDGEDARDFDDAVSLTMGRGGVFTLGVHIADVSHFVTEGDVLDLEARLRATSVYFPEGAVPMLPEALSCGACSLAPGEDRLALTCRLVFSRDGLRASCDVFPSIIRSAHRLTYEVVERMLVAGGDRELRVTYQDVFPMLTRMGALARLLHRHRLSRGSLDFALVEPTVRLDERGRVLDIRPLGDPVARNVIEEFMIAANEAIADLAGQRELPLLYRIHEVPDPAKVRELAAIAEALGIRWTCADPSDPAELQRLLDRLPAGPDGDFVRTLALRSLKQARYHPANVGHFGLASRGYTHFTSPIRRYPDLIVHRLVKHHLGRPRVPEADYQALVEGLEERAIHSSEMERRAQEAERAAVAQKMARYMEDKVGRRFRGRITGLASHGLFVTLEGTLVEGLVALRDMPADGYRYSEKRFMLSGEASGRVWRLGDPIQVRVATVDVLARQVRFHLA
jgi:ribonuclease R